MTNPEKKSGCGCFAKGCIVVIIIAALFTGLIAWQVRRAIVWAHTQTSGSPAEVPGVNATQDEYDAVMKKLDDFKNAEPGSAKTLELTANDLNVLIARSPEWKDVRGKIHATIDNDVVGLTGSVPLARVPFFRAQYLNGDITFTMSIEDKVFHAQLRSAKFGDGEFSRDELKKISDNLEPKLEPDSWPLIGPVLAKAKTVEVKGGSLVLTSE